VLGAAGLRKVFRAQRTGRDRFLTAFGAIRPRRGVRRPHRVTGGGVTAGIDSRLTLVSLLVDRRPPKPFSSGSNTIRRRRSMPARRHRAAGDCRFD